MFPHRCAPYCKSLVLVLVAVLSCVVLVNAHAQTGDVVVSTSTAGAMGTYRLTSLTVNSGATVTVGGGSTVTVAGTVVVTGNSNIVLQRLNTSAQVNNVWAGTGVTLNAGSVQVDSGSSIYTHTQGYTAQAALGRGTCTDSAGYGGAGDGLTATSVYRSATNLSDLGSGGRRAAVYYDSTTNFTGFAGSTAAGGTVASGGSVVPGAVGTVVFIDTSATNDNVSVYQNFIVPASSTVQYNSLTVTNGRLL